jgi:hypothetical protein
MIMKYILVTLVICLVFLAGCESSPKQEGSTADKPIVQNNEPIAQTTGNGGSGDGSQNLGGKTTISKLLTSGKSLRCTYEEKMEKDNTLSETIYVSGKKFRIDILMSAMEGYEFHMISDGKWVYTWNSLANKGTKFNAAELEGTKPINGGQQGADINKEMELDCRSWVPQSSMFDLPSGMEFTDDTAELKDAVENFDPEKIRAQTCAMCKGAPSEELRQQCMGDIECP